MFSIVKKEKMFMFLSFSYFHFPFNKNYGERKNKNTVSHKRHEIILFINCIVLFAFLFY